MGWTAQGHSVLTRGKLIDDLKHLASLCAEYEIEKVVLGFPRNMNGTVGPKGEEIMDFGRTLGEYTKIPLDYWDERLSTVEAERVLLEGNVSRQKRKSVIDKMAAMNILQGYLERLANK
jgi:putative Holliday junction resolvase